MAVGDAISTEPRSLDRGLTLVLLTVLLVGLGFVVWYWSRLVQTPYQLDYGEGPLLDQAVRLAGGVGIYAVPGAAPPWTIGNYPPLYPLVNAGFVELFGPAYWYGRLVSVVGALAAATFAGLLVATLSSNRTAGVITGLLMPVVPYLGYWSGLARIDSMALALSLAGLWCVVRRPSSKGWLVAGGVLLVAAGFTRQTYLLAAPLAAVVWLWPYGRRRAAVFAAGLAGAVLALGAALDLATRGGFWFNVVTANVNAYDLGLLHWVARDVVIRLPVLLAVAVASIVVSVRERLPYGRLLVPYGVGAIAVALTAGKVGSNLNYLLELSAALCLAAGLLLAALRARPRLRTVLLLALVAQALLLVLRPHPYYGYAIDAARDVSTGQQVSRVVAGTAGPVLADEHLGFLPLAGRAVELQPFELTQLVYAGVWNQAPLLAAIDEQRYAAILIYTTDATPSLEQYRWTPEMLAAIERRYAVAETIERDAGRILVYRPAD